MNILKKLLLVLALVAAPAVAQNNVYSTRFTATENPISQSGHWLNGLTNGLDWSDMQSSSAFGMAYGTVSGVGPNFTDSTAVLTGTWGPNQTACATVNLRVINSSIHQELELRLRTSISAHSITGYEFDWRTINDGSQYFAIVSWDGPLNSFHNIYNPGIPSGGLVNGDNICVQVVGGTLSATKNGTQIVSIADTTCAGAACWPSGGSPGIGAAQDSGGTAANSNVGFSNFFASDEPSSCAGVTACITASNSLTDTQTALNSINQDNTVLTIRPGTGAVSWSGKASYSNTHPMTLQCLGTVATSDSHGNPLTYNDILTITETQNGVAIDLGGTSASAQENRLTGCTVTATGATDNGAIVVGGVVIGNSGGGRVDHNHFIQLHAAMRQFGFGVVDHNLFDTTGNGISNGVQVFTDFGHTGNNAWHADTALGTYNFVFIENNTFLDGFGNDCVVGGRYVFRFNTMNATTSTGGEVQSHATGSTQGWRGCRAWEIYNNFVTSTFAGQNFAFSQPLSGTGVQYNNTITSVNGTYAQDIFTHVNRGELSTNYTQPSPPNGLGTCGPGNTPQTGTVNLTHTGVATWVSGGQFSTSWPAGSIVVMNGTNYAIISVSSATLMTVAGDTNHALPATTVTAAYGAASAFDPNRYTNGGPCLDSFGTGKGDQLQGSVTSGNACNATTTDCANNIFTGGSLREAVEPVYVWNETLTNVGQWSAISDPGGNIGGNRDFYFLCGPSNSSCSGGFTGTVGVGSGPLASRPATCTAGIVTGSPYNVNGQATGVAWWETDHNQLDYCYFNGTSNVWSTLASTPKSYTAFTYPHPLVATSSLAPPTNLHVTPGVLP